MGVSIEVVAVTIDDAIAAEQGGADRLELIANFLEGGTTPSPGVIRSVKRAVSIPVYVMIRPRGGGFVYSPSEIEAMVEDAMHAADAGADGIVVGMLRQDGTLDSGGLLRVIEAASLPVTFHRAFDEIPVNRMPGVLDELAQMPHIERVLTSGGQQNPYLGKQVIADLVKRGRLSIMPGGGVRAEGLRDLVSQTGVKEIHVGSAAREPQHPTAPVSEVRVRRLREILG